MNAYACNVTRAVEVGKIDVFISSAGNVQVRYEMLPTYHLQSTNLYIGTVPFPKKDVANPKKYPFNEKCPEFKGNGTYEINRNLSSAIYVIAFGKVCS